MSSIKSDKKFPDYSCLFITKAKLKSKEKEGLSYMKILIFPRITPRIGTKAG